MGPVRDDLEAWQCEQGATTGLVAATQTGGHLHLGNWRKRAFKPAAAAAGVEANPYDGRASYASLRIHGGESPLAVAAAHGHASAETTWKHYAGLFEEARLASSVDPEDAIRAARKAIAGSRLRTGCDERRRGHLRLVS